jgi:hypothetical protein
MMYKNLWDIDYKVVPSQFLETAIDRLIEAREHEPDRCEEIEDMIRSIRKELTRRLWLADYAEARALNQ